MQPDYQQKLAELLNDSFAATLGELSDEQPLMDLQEWDSLSHMQFITSLEEKFGFELTGDEIADMQTVGDVKAVIVAKTSSAA